MIKQNSNVECGSSFDDDYRKKHELKFYDGKNTKIKHVNAPKNSFEGKPTSGKKTNNSQP